MFEIRAHRDGENLADAKAEDEATAYEIYEDYEAAADQGKYGPGEITVDIADEEENIIASVTLNS